MKFTKSALNKLIREAVEGDKIISERPWSVEFTFKLSGGSASDSEGEGPDGFAIVADDSAGTVARFIVDSYWNPQTGDSSGNSLKFEMNGAMGDSTYVPVKFDDGKKQRIIISNSPVEGLISVAHAHGTNVPVVYLVVKNPFSEGEDLEFSIENLGNGAADVKMTGHTNL